ncbi:MAG: ATP-grasp domain-containing protein [Lewinellaceae bacterium]|nr:ATP-grasp domain-containing protein [candidate division KSB1 bacterium]MCB9294678.1 ATP-grasp domain-containing protein [Lewinellaceae bacterium]
MVKIGLFYNLRKDWIVTSENPVDINADWDITDTVGKLKEGLSHNDFEVLDLKDPELLLQKDVRNNIDIVFSICEMQGFRYRESIVPSICEFLQIPYVFSSPDSLMLSLDKNVCNFLVKQAGGNVPNWEIVTDSKNVNLKRCSDYPYIIKPIAEGSGIGITKESVVCNANDLMLRTEYLLDAYKQPVLIQQYIEGREITVGLIEKESTIHAFVPIEVRPKELQQFLVYGFNEKENADSLFDFVPFEEDCDIVGLIKDTSIKAFRAINCRDAARVDIRLSKKNIPYFIEINPLPHMHPDIGDFCRSAKLDGINYFELLDIIINNSLKRYKLR